MIRERFWMQRFLKRRRKRSTNTTIIINIRSMLLRRNLKGSCEMSGYTQVFVLDKSELLYQVLLK